MLFQLQKIVIQKIITLYLIIIKVIFFPNYFILELKIKKIINFKKIKKNQSFILNVTLGSKHWIINKLKWR